jgi:hypothetical protein
LPSAQDRAEAASVRIAMSKGVLPNLKTTSIKFHKITGFSNVILHFVKEQIQLISFVVLFDKIEWFADDAGTIEDISGGCAA